MIKIKPFLILIAVLGLSFQPAPQNVPTTDFCGIKNTSFKAGEKVIMKVYYSTLGAYIGAGEASFTTTIERFNGKPVYHCIGDGKTYSFFDNFLKCVTGTRATLILPAYCPINF